MKKKVLLFLLITILISSACGTSKKTVSKGLSVGVMTDASKMTALDIIRFNENQQITVQWLSGNAGLDYKGRPMSVSASSNIVWRRDSIIFLSIKKFGFSVAKAKVTRDSIFIHNQIQGTNIAEPISYIETHYGIPGNFDMVQKILFGQPVFLTDKKNLKPVYNASLQTLTLSGSNAKHNAVYNFDTSDFQLKDMTIEEPAASRSINIINGNADVLGDKKFAYLRTININSPQTGKAVIVIDVDNKSVEIDVPKNIKF